MRTWAISQRSSYCCSTDKRVRLLAGIQCPLLSTKVQLPKFAGCHAFVRQELPVEVGQIAIARQIGDGGDAELSVNQGRASAAQPKARSVFDRAEARVALKKPMEGGQAEAGNPSQIRNHHGITVVLVKMVQNPPNPLVAWRSREGLLGRRTEAFSIGVLR